MKLSNQIHRERMRLIIAAYLRLTERNNVLPENVDCSLLTIQYGYSQFKRTNLLKSTLMALTSYRKEIRRRGQIPDVQDTLDFVYKRLNIFTK